MATVGGEYRLESQEARALKTITVESYDKDQAKTLIKLKQDVSYMAAYQRKMQKGIDDANMNLLEQIQSAFADIIVLLGGGDNQGFDFFGDLKYVLKAFGAVFGFNTPTKTAQEATSHMTTNYLATNVDFSNLSYERAEEWAGTIGVDATTVPGINNTFTDIWGGIIASIQGWADVRDQAAANATLVEQSATIASMSAMIQEMISREENQAVGGKSAVVDFRGLANGAALPGFGPLQYSGAGTGTWAIENGALRWQPTATAPRWVIAPYTAVELGTDYHFVGASFRTAPSWFNSVAADENFLICRANAAYTDYCYARFTKYLVEVGYVVGGVRTVVYTENTFTFKPTAFYGLYVGKVGTLRYFDVVESKKPILSRAEVGTGSKVGESSPGSGIYPWRWTAIGAMGYATGFGSGRPGDVTAMAIADNYPATVIGSTCELRRTNATAVNVSVGENILPASFFDVASIFSEDWTYNLTTGRITSLRGGQISINARIEFNGSNMPSKFHLIVFKNGDTANPIYIGGTSMRGNNNLGGTEWPECIFATTSLQMAVNDYIQLGYHASAAVGSSIKGAVAVKTYLKASLESRTRE